jgi:hypothetical protein
MGKSGLNKFIYLLQASLYFFGRDAGVVERGGLATAFSGVPPKAEKTIY